MKILHRILHLLLIVALFSACLPAAPAVEVETEPIFAEEDVDAPAEEAQAMPEEGAVELPDGERWLRHFRESLLPFWDQPAALGEPIGNFPSKRCNDGSLFDAARPCPEIAENGWLMMNTEYVVSRSRQTYGYGVAFHLTGDPRYLEYARAGVNYLRENAFDRVNGGTHSYWNGDTRTWEPDPLFRNPQELAYSLLGISFYYYLTRDATVLPDILAVKDYIFDRYYNESLNALQWNQASDGQTNPLDKRLVAQLDNLNAYMVLMSPLLPAEEQAAWNADMTLLAELMIDEFYAAEENLFFLQVNQPSDKDLRNAGTDFGHTIKAMWMIYYVGLLTENQEFVDFAREKGPLVLERAYHSPSGSWANGVHQGGALDLDKDWWIYNELDQFAMTMSLSDPSLAETLSRTTQYYFLYFVDPLYGEVWTRIDGRTNQPSRGALPKAWPWKSAYHSFEHALVGYITAQQFYQQPVRLYYAFVQEPAEAEIRPYFFRGELSSMQVQESSGQRIYQVDFINIH